MKTVQSCYNCVHLNVCKSWAEITGHPERLDLNIGCTMFKLTTDAAEVRHGEWGFDGLGWTCSECGEYALTNKAKLQVHSNHCPHCGAKMDGERRERGK